MTGPLWVEAVGLVAMATNIVGNLLLAWKHRGGWLIRLFSIVCWGVHAAHLGSVAMMANAVAFCGINCVGWWKWRQPAVAAPPPILVEASNVAAMGPRPTWPVCEGCGQVILETQRYRYYEDDVYEHYPECPIPRGN